MAPLGGTSPLFLKSVSQRPNNTFYRAKSRASFTVKSTWRSVTTIRGFRYLLSQTLLPQNWFRNKAVPIFVTTTNGPTPLFKGAVLLNGV
jgi:hypothetical protein